MRNKTLIIESIDKTGKSKQVYSKTIDLNVAQIEEFLRNGYNQFFGEIEVATNLNDPIFKKKTLNFLLMIFLSYQYVQELLS